MANPSLAQYRKAIRDAWLKAMNRGSLKSAEYTWIKHWFKNGYDVGIVLRAISRCVKRSAESGRSIWTIGVIQADINALLKVQGRSLVGKHSECDGDDWRQSWRESLEELAEGSSNPEIAATYKELKAELVGLSREEAQKRYNEIKEVR
jgi:hypothetical protein